MKAAIKADISMTELLLDKGAEINATTNDGKTTLMVAASAGRTELVKHLLDKGADIDAVDKEGKSALSWALANHHAQLGKFLLESMAQKRTPQKGTGHDGKKETLGQTGAGRR
ncbi:MAG: ankyrin repeat domain-containing protein [Desulfomonilaceae bacterium]